jgi:hypothetical protein
MQPLLLRAALAVTVFWSLTASAVEATKDWTVLVFLNGHNSLDSFGKQNIDSMAEVGSTSRVNVVVQWATEAGGNTKRVFVKKGGFDVIEDMGLQADMGDYNNLVAFAKWGMQKYPAKKYLIDVWDHGNGWHLQDFNPMTMKFRPHDLSYDDLSGHVITTEQLGLALAEIAKLAGGKIELYGSDACLMAMGEVAAEVQSSVKYFAGSQETEPGAGWPYSQFLAHLTAHPDWNGGQAGAALAEDYKAAYSGGVYGQAEVTFSTFDMSKFDAFLGAVRALSSELTALDAQAFSAVQSAGKTALGFTLPDYKDLGDFLDGAESTGALRASQSLGAVRAALGHLVVSTQNSGTYAKAHGLSVWLPEATDFSSFSERYQAMKFNQKTGWYNFLAKDVGARP